MKVLQCGYPGSGNWMFWRMMSMYQKSIGKHRCLKEHVFPGHEGGDPALTIPDIQSIDLIAREPGDPNLCELVEDGGARSTWVSLELIDSWSSFIWTHDVALARKLPQRTHRYLIVRDGADALASNYAKYRRACAIKKERPDGIDVPKVARAWRLFYLAALEQQWDGIVRYESMSKGTAWAYFPVSFVVQSNIKRVLGLYPEEHRYQFGTGGGERLGIAEEFNEIAKDVRKVLGYV